MHYARIISEALTTPWAILPTKLAVIRNFLAVKSQGGDIPRSEIEAFIQTDKPKSNTVKTARGSVAVIPVHGTIVQRANYFTEISGGVSTQSIGEQIDKMANDASVEAIILDMHSPGGTVYGVGQLADKIAAIKSKPVIAVANSLVASAAYWIGSQASEFIVTSDAEIGSIGVYQMTFDETKALDNMGIVPTMIKSTELKASGNPYEPLTDAMRAELQKGVDDYYRQFVAAVARGRKTTAETVENLYGKGGTVRANEAVRVGMADKIGTLGEVLTRFGTPAKPSNMPQNQGKSVQIEKHRLRI